MFSDDLDRFGKSGVWLAERLVGVEGHHRAAVLRRLTGIAAIGITPTPEILDEIIAGAVDDAEWETQRLHADGHRQAEINAQRLETAHERERAQRGALNNPRALVYYLKFADRVKIGTTISLKNRLLAIPHDELLALEPGSYDVEYRRHQQFADLRITGEWFRYEEPLIGHIANLRAEPAA